MKALLAAALAAVLLAPAPIDIDLRTRVVMPGWIDTHVHLNWHFDDRHISVSGGEPGNPLDDITAVRRVRFVMKAGKVYKS